MTSTPPTPLSRNGASEALAPGSVRLNDAAWRGFLAASGREGAAGSPALPDLVTAPGLSGDAVEGFLRSVGSFRAGGAPVVECPAGFESSWLSATCSSGLVTVALAAGASEPVRSERPVRVADAALPAANAAHRLLALVLAEANALLPAWRVARASVAWSAAA
jgi:hypothetical protein